MLIEYPNIEGNGEIYLDVMKAICGITGNKSVVDLMCHRSPYVPFLGFKERTYVDIQDRPLDFKEEQKLFIQEDIFTYLSNVKNNQFDVSICSDGLEHLTEEGAAIVLDETIAKFGRSIFFTPLGEWMVSADVHPDSHRSGWTPDKLIKMGYKYNYIVFPHFHKLLNTGAFFFWFCDTGIKTDFERVKNELNKYSWTKGSN